MTLRVENEERATQGAITFNTQEEFDSAVMAAVERYLKVRVRVVKSYYTNNQDIEVSLNNASVEFSYDVDTVAFAEG